MRDFFNALAMVVSSGSKRLRFLLRSDNPGRGMRTFLLGFVVGSLALPVVAFTAAWLGVLPTNANATPSRLERAFAHLALDAATARRAPHLANPIPPTEQNLMDGMKLFKNDCVQSF
jgi:hypothetical protein